MSEQTKVIPVKKRELLISLYTFIGKQTKSNGLQMLFLIFLIDHCFCYCSNTIV